MFHPFSYPPDNILIVSLKEKKHSSCLVCLFLNGIKVMFTIKVNSVTG